MLYTPEALVYAYDAMKFGGPSLQDWNAQKTSEQVPDGPGLFTFHSVPFYIIDSDNIYRADPNTSPTKYSQTPRWKRRTSSCTVL